MKLLATKNFLRNLYMYGLVGHVFFMLQETTGSKQDISAGFIFLFPKRYVVGEVGSIGFT